MHNLIVTNDPRQWDIHVEGVEVISAQSYLKNNNYADLPHMRVFNLCRSYRYQSSGYYVSLLAAARGHKVFPDVTTIQDFNSQAIVRIMSEELDVLIQKLLTPLKSKDFILSIYFGKNIARQYDELSIKLSNLFQAPLLRARFVYNKKWVLQNITPIPLNEIPLNHRPYVIEFAREYFHRTRFVPMRKKQYRYDLAILVNPQERHPPSDKGALRKFISAGRKIGFAVELITRDDYHRISEFDALFIRETTFVNHYTYRFSRRAWAEGLVVIDDPLSILRCTNKVYLAELLTHAKISIPQTLIVNKDNIRQIEQTLKLPCVLKQPDSSFSQGVVKVETAQMLEEKLEFLLKKSDLIIAQEFVPTEYDWRIGIIGGKAIYACKYFMAKRHWQIYDWQNGPPIRNYGATETMPIEKAPLEVVKASLRTAKLIGDGFYGVDLKCVDGKVYVIEINDNPSIEIDTEDRVLKSKLYSEVMLHFLKKLQKNNGIG
ncbi:MAG: RimK family protein [Candidatus Omnitrophica bacterium]|nr:RimK family protein [Candidatus Omnitrophota bacterium]MBU1925171.1 RimK family protein [Candidatus Omnitrophota bacterium]